MGNYAGLKNYPVRFKAFTLIELLVVIAVIALLMSVLLPSLKAAKTQTRKIICRTNLHQLALANLSYTSENDEHYVPAASDINDPDMSRRNLTRWHGKRETLNDPFDSNQGPLSDYFQTGKVKECPERMKFVKGQPWSVNYEDGTGGYGYNSTYIGSRQWDAGTLFPMNDRNTTKTTEVGSPGGTLMFADCAITKNAPDGVPYYLETSFAWQVYIVFSGMVMDGTNGTPEMYQSPTIHFRHSEQANIAWTDGHVTGKEMVPFDQLNAFGVNSSKISIGWFEPLNNSLYDLK